MNQLEKARAKIDSIDRELARLYEERMKTLQDVAAYKQAHGLAVVDTSREEAIVQKIGSLSRIPLLWTRMSVCSAL